MQKLKAHIGYKISLVALILALLAPSLVKLAHAFEIHKHDVCKTPQKNHYHKLNLVCEFYKFKLGYAFNFQTEPFSFLIISEPLHVNNIYKSFYKNSQLEQPSLRGPPQLI
jgi:hypothetical protein